jgi:hypothetical protein
MLERDVEKYFVAQCKKHDWLCWKMQSMSLRGFPDRMVVTGSGRIHFCEIKAEGGRVSPLQKAVAAKLAGKRVQVYLAVGKAGVDQMIEYILEKENNA